MATIALAVVLYKSLVPCSNMVSTCRCTHSLLLASVCSAPLLADPMVTNGKAASDGMGVTNTDNYKDKDSSWTTTTSTTRVSKAIAELNSPDDAMVAPEYCSVSSVIVVSELSDERHTHSTRCASSYAQELIMAQSIYQIVSHAARVRHRRRFLLPVAVEGKGAAALNSGR